MNPTRKPAAHRFPERVLRNGWVGEASVAQPVVGDRLRSIVTDNGATSLGHPVRISRIEHNNGMATYHLADAITIVASPGARIFWEEQ